MERISHFLSTYLIAFIFFFVSAGLCHANIFGDTSSNVANNLSSNNQNLNNNSNSNKNQNSNKNYNNNQNNLSNTNNLSNNISNKNTNNIGVKNTNVSDNRSSAKSSANAASGSNSYAKINTKNSVQIEDSKEYPSQGNVQFAELPAFFGKDTRDQQFIPIETLLQYNTKWSIASAKKMANDAMFDRNIRIVPLAREAEKSSSEIICITQKIDQSKYDVQVLLYGTVLATDQKVISAEIFGNALLEAAKYGATHIEFLAEGTNTTLVAQGFGIGFSTTKADSMNTISTGGTGYSKGWSEYINPPWIQFQALYVSKK